MSFRIQVTDASRDPSQLILMYEFQAPSVYLCGKLIERQCSYPHCPRHVKLGGPMCRQHTQLKYGVKMDESHVAGIGVFATRAHQENQDICPYHGIVEPRYVLDGYYSHYTAPYAIRIPPHHSDTSQTEMVENADLLRGIGSLINHSQHDANVMFYRSNGVMRVKAMRAIEEGEELLANYGDAYQLQEHGVHFATAAVTWNVFDQRYYKPENRYMYEFQHYGD